MLSVKTPLWLIMANVHAKATELGIRDLDMIAKGNAAVIRVLADWLVPQTPIPSGGDAARTRWLTRRELRDELLYEAERAKTSHSSEDNFDA
jgi:hypothetical protein